MAVYRRHAPLLPAGKSVTEIVGFTFEQEAATVLRGRTLHSVCAWATELTELEGRDEVSYMVPDTSPDAAPGATKKVRRQVDLFCYCSGDTLAECTGVAEAGVRVVGRADGDAFVRALPAVGVAADAEFSPPNRRGPLKYFVGEIYSGEDKQSRIDKVRQLESALEFLCHRFTDRTEIVIVDPTQLIGAAMLVFPTLAGTSRSDQFDAALTLVRTSAGPLLQRLIRAGRLALTLLTPEQAPGTYGLRSLASEQLAQGKTLTELRRSIEALRALLLQRLPPIRE